MLLLAALTWIILNRFNFNIVGVVVVSFREDAVEEWPPIRLLPFIQHEINQLTGIDCYSHFMVF